MRFSVATIFALTALSTAAPLRRRQAGPVLADTTFDDISIAGGVAGSVLYTLTEMVASRPLTGALIDLPHTFLDPAAGFAVAVSYA